MPEPGRRPLKPLPPQLDGPVREFTEQLRAVFWDRTELNQRGLAEALHLTKSPVSRYLNGQEVIPADTFAALCRIAGLTPREQERLGRLRELAAEAAERARSTAEQEAAGHADVSGSGPGSGAATVSGTGAGTGSGAGTGTGTGPGAGGTRQSWSRSRSRSWLRQWWELPLAARLRSPAGFGALAAVAALCAGTFALTWAETSGGGPANTTADKPGSSPSCRMTRVYRVIKDGDILDAGRHDIGDVHADDVFRLDEAPVAGPYRFRDFGHVAGSRTKGYVDQAKLKAIGSRCVDEPR